ncbi:hypothetical protein [Azonexus hydrophilus]
MAFSEAHWAASAPGILDSLPGVRQLFECAVPSLLQEVDSRIPCANDLAGDVRLAQVRNPPADGIADDLPGPVAEEHADCAAQDAADGNSDGAADCSGHCPQLRAGEHAADAAGESASGFPGSFVLLAGSASRAVDVGRRADAADQRAKQRDAAKQSSPAPIKPLPMPPIIPAPPASIGPTPGIFDSRPDISAQHAATFSAALSFRPFLDILRPCRRAVSSLRNPVSEV